jgi:hypothetical protein
MFAAVQAISLEIAPIQSEDVAQPPLLSETGPKLAPVVAERVRS